MIILITSILTAYNRKNAVPHLCKHCPDVRKTEIISANRQSTNPPRILYLAVSYSCSFSLSHSSGEAAALKQISGDCSLSDLFTH